MSPIPRLNTFTIPLHHRLFLISGCAVYSLSLVLILLSMTFKSPTPETASPRWRYLEWIDPIWIPFLGIGASVLLLLSTVFYYLAIRRRHRQQFSQSLTTIPVSTLTAGLLAGALDFDTREAILSYLNASHPEWARTHNLIAHPASNQISQEHHATP